MHWKKKQLDPDPQKMNANLRPCLFFYVMFNATGNYYLLLMFTRSIMDQLGQTEVNNTDKQVFINHLFVASRERELG